MATEYIINSLVKAYPGSHTTPIARCWFQTYFCSPLFGNHSHFDSYFAIGLRPPKLRTPPEIWDRYQNWCFGKIRSPFKHGYFGYLCWISGEVSIVRDESPKIPQRSPSPSCLATDALQPVARGWRHQASFFSEAHVLLDGLIRVVSSCFAAIGFFEETDSMNMNVSQFNATTSFQKGSVLVDPFGLEVLVETWNISFGCFDAWSVGAGVGRVRLRWSLKSLMFDFHPDLLPNYLEEWKKNLLFRLYRGGLYYPFGIGFLISQW